MQKKNKVMLAAAIGMVVIVIGATAVRCSIAHTVEESAQNEAQAPAESIAAGCRQTPTPQTRHLQRTSPRRSRSCSGATYGRPWARPRRRIEFRDRAFVESDGASVRLTAFDVRQAGETGGQKHLDIDFMREGDPCTTPASIIVEERDGVLTVASDAFAVEPRYVQGKPAGTSRERVRARRALHGAHRREVGRARLGRRRRGATAHAPSATERLLRRRGLPGRARTGA